MALVRKDSTIQLRLPQELLDKYRELCESRDVTVSSEIRDFIRRELGRYERQVGEAAERQRRAEHAQAKAAAHAEAEAILAAQVSAPSSAPPPAPKVDPVRAPGSLAERRALEKEAKRRKVQERADKW